MNTNQPLAELFGDKGVMEREPTDFVGLNVHVITEQPRPDVEGYECHRLRKLLAEIIQQRTYWQSRADGEGNWKDLLDDSAELKAFCGQAAVALGPVIGAVTAAADEHERRLLEMESRS